jgi:hypothetical protein
LSTPQEISEKERIILKSHQDLIAMIEFGSSISQCVGQSSQLLRKLIEIFKEEKYFLYYNGKSERVDVVLHMDSTMMDMLKAYFNALTMVNLIKKFKEEQRNKSQGKSNIISKYLDSIRSKRRTSQAVGEHCIQLVEASFRTTQENFANFLAQLSESNWNINNVMLVPNTYRAVW